MKSNTWKVDQVVLSIMCKACKVFQTNIYAVTTRLLSSKLVVYLSVQKSRAAANVVGAYVWWEEFH